MKTALVLCALLVPTLAALADEVQVYFSPKQGCRAAIVNEVKKAQTSILVEEYSFRKEAMPIAKALVEKAQKGIKVEVILNRGKANLPLADYFTNNDIPVKIDPNQTNHNKVMVIDGETVITGSYNLSKEAEERNGENLVVIHGKETAKQFTTDWNKHFEQSETYKGQNKKPPEKTILRGP